MKDTLVILEEVNHTIPRCPKCDIYFTGGRWMLHIGPRKYVSRGQSGNSSVLWRRRCRWEWRRTSRPTGDPWMRWKNLNTLDGSLLHRITTGRRCRKIFGRLGVDGPGSPGFGAGGGRPPDLRKFLQGSSSGDTIIWPGDLDDDPPG